MAASLNMFCSWTNQLNTWDFLELASSKNYDIEQRFQGMSCFEKMP